MTSTRSSQESSAESGFFPELRVGVQELKPLSSVTVMRTMYTPNPDKTLNILRLSLPPHTKHFLQEMACDRASPPN